jgi:serine phosphatase RsbU (regulator of sigma subunit)/HAMP domain-containing protein
MVNVTYFFTIRELSGKREAVESQIRSIAENIATMQLLDRQDWGVYQNYISQLSAFNNDIIYIAIFDDRGILRAHTLNLNLVDIEISNPSRRMQAEIVRKLERSEIVAENQDDLKTQQVDILIGERIIGSVHVGFSLVQINEELKSGIRLNVALGLFFLILFSAASIFISGRLTKPIEKLSSAMSQVVAGNLEHKIEIQTRDEIGHLASNFNDMLEGLREKKIIENLGAELSSTFRLADLAKIVRERICSAIGAHRARLYIKNKELSAIFEEITVAKEDKQKFPPLEIDTEVRKYILQKPTGFMVRSCPDVVLRALKHDQTGEAGMIIPMMIKEELFGLLFFALSRKKERFTAQQQQFAAFLANQAALALENALLYEGVREQERMMRELEIAKEVQQNLLPKNMPQIAGFEIDGICKAAQEVGGDYFDFFTLDDNYLGIVIADVSGKGTSASFYMAEIKGMMLQLTSRKLSPSQLLIEVNKQLYSHLDRRMFVTMIYGVLEISTKKLIFSRAGHNALLYIKKNGYYQFLTPPGIGLGLDSGDLFDRKINEMTLELNNQDMLIFYTDGITDAMNDKQEEFGEDRLLECIQNHKNQLVKIQKEKLMQSIEMFMNASPQHDDITMVIVKSC